MAKNHLLNSVFYQIFFTSENLHLKNCVFIDLGLIVGFSESYQLPRRSFVRFLRVGHLVLCREINWLLVIDAEFHFP